MNILIAGADVVGFRIAEELMTSHRIVYLDEHEGASSRLDRLDVERIQGSITSPEVLQAARVQEADLFVACTTSDERNIVGCIAAQRMGAKRTMCMLTRPGFLSVQDDVDLADSLGIDAVIRPAEQLAEEIVRICTVPGALDVEEFAEGRVRLLRYSVEESAPITQAPLREIRLPGQCTLIMVRRGEKMIIPEGDTRVEPGDKVIAMGRWNSLRRLLVRFLREQTQEAEKRRATIVGAGTVGLAVARGLEEAGWRIKIIEHNRARCEVVAGQVKSLVLHGDGADIDLLEQERIGDDPVLVAVADNDEKNLLVSLLAKQLGVKRTITRASRLANELMFEKVGVDVVRSAKGAAIRSVVESVDLAHSEIRAELEHGDACVIELTLPSRFPTVQLKDLTPPTFARVGSILRKRRVIIPTGDDELRPLDQVLIFCTRADEDRTRDFFMDPRASQLTVHKDE